MTDFDEMTEAELVAVECNVIDLVRLRADLEDVRCKATDALRALPDEPRAHC